MYMWNSIAEVPEDPKASNVVGKTRYLKNLAGPVRPGAHMGGHGLVINTDSKNKQAAFEFAAWVTANRGAHSLYGVYGGMPTRTEVMTDPELLGKIGYLKPSGETFAEMANSRPTLPEWPELEEPMGIWLSKAVTGDVTVKEALENIADETEKILDEAGYYDLSSEERELISRESQIVPADYDWPTKEELQKTFL